ncbi:MAG: saccharopine dehydrogenase NADP-binding domain-containing protein [Solirubrobacteraceae bacterium]
MAEREYDLVLFGATGFTGGLTAEYLAANADGTRWAIAGRNPDKLEAVRERLGGTGAAGELGVLQADIADREAIRRVAESARVVITTVGPYINYGEPLVAACAAAGTDYVDLTGEPEFVDLMWLRYHEQAVRSGARLVHSCGFDSIPHDLGAFYTVNQLPEDVPIKVEGFVKASGTISGGTLHSAVHAMARLRHGRRVAGQRSHLEGKPTGRRIKGLTGPPRHDDIADGWILPVPTIDPIVVLRSARALERYGPDFSYGHYLVTKRLATLAGFAAGAGTVAALAQLPPTRNLLLKLKDPGDGPSEEQREKAWFKVRFHGRSDSESVVTEVSGGDFGYTESAKMLAESALCLAHDDLPELSGQLTTAAAMGQPLTDRLSRAGIEFRTLEP